MTYESEIKYPDLMPKQKKFEVGNKNSIYDTIVIGSGPGGSIAALRLLEKGEKVAIIESGQAYQPGVIQHHSFDQTKYQFYKQGMTICFGNIPLIFGEGSTYGGGSEINSGLYFRLEGPYRKKFLEKSNISDEEWKIGERVVEDMLSIQKAPDGTYDTINSALIRGSKELDLICEEIPRWRKYSPKRRESGNAGNLSEKSRKAWTGSVYRVRSEKDYSKSRLFRTKSSKFIK